MGVMLANLLRRIGRLLDFPAPKWLADYAMRDIEKEIAALNTERTSELARAEPRRKHLDEIDKSLAELKKLRDEFP